MSETIASLQHQLGGAKDLHAVVRTMKAVAAASIGQYEKSVLSLVDYSRTVELGLSICLHADQRKPAKLNQSKVHAVGAVVFGSDQGLVGQFNEVVVETVVKTLSTLPAKPLIWAAGARVREGLIDAGLPVLELFAVPTAVATISSLVGKILVDCETSHSRGDISELYLFYNRPTSGAGYETFNQKILPLDKEWRRQMTQIPWPTKRRPEILGDNLVGLQGFLREYLFVSIFRACAKSLASENASRLSAMQRAEKNINELVDVLSSKFHRLRQSGIDEELFDVIASFEALK